MEKRMLQAEREREELEEAQRRAEESRLLAEEAVHLEKAERELRASSIGLCAEFRLRQIQRNCIEIVEIWPFFGNPAKSGQIF